MVRSKDDGDSGRLVIEGRRDDENGGFSYLDDDTVIYGAFSRKCT
jgi:hypothetical protein